MRKIAFAALLCLASAGLAASPADAASPGTCAAYADHAAWQFSKARSTRGCYKRASNLWHGDRERHYGWCLGADPRTVAQQRRVRDLAISDCDPSYGD